ncbi:flagellin-like protein [Sphingorhabdus sp. IMCC26285]|jgi:flagellar hook-associated protein 3 FlgL|uniref:Flagellin n=1 Tax=Sphingorhabdus profundilacus TaxID=2509718 RepID=A0A6I4LWS8_9SPHN|nr:flagellin [Sphingorhabdus profundilacus]MVZ97997.1 flagellin-like protein [Sphingorhabdus profundilacus]
MINATGNRMTQEIQRQSRMAQQIAEKQTQISTGKRLQRASDNPVATARIADLARSQANDAARAANINLGITMTAQADGSLRQMSGLLARAKELTLAGASSSASPADRGSIAIELTTIADEIDAMALTKSATGQPLFASGSNMAIRFDDNAIFAPVPSQAEVFDIAGISIGQIIRDTASAITAGNAAQIGTSNTAVDSAINHVADVTAAVGINAARLERIDDNSALRSISIKEERSALEDTDFSAAIAELNGMTLTLEAAQAAFARINRRTLMDFLN